MNKSLTFKNGLVDGIPIMLGYFAVSIAFGVTAVNSGLDIIVSIIISMTNLTSAGQLAGVTVIVGLGTVLEMALTELVINSRYFLMSLSLTQKLDKKFTIFDRFLCAFGVTDEIFAVAVSKKEVSRNYFLGLMLLPYVGWTLGTVLGALLGGFLPKILLSAFSIALYAMFIAIVIPGCIEDKNVIAVVLISAGLSCAFYYIPTINEISKGISIVICALVSSIICSIIRPIKEEDGDA